MPTTFVHRDAAPISLTERAWSVMSAFLVKVGDIYNRDDVAKRSGQSWHYFSA